MSPIHPRIGWLVACASALLAAQNSLAQVSGFLSTPDGSGLVAANAWAPVPAGYGYRISWTIMPNSDPLNSWHYKYEFSDESGNPLPQFLTSHVVLQLSDNILSEDLFNWAGDIESIEFGTFGPGAGNPGFPAIISTRPKHSSLVFNHEDTHNPSVSFHAI